MRKIDRSDLIALIALLISVVGTVISVSEARLMNRQLDLMDAQKSATVWPYADVRRSADYGTDPATITLEIVNHGIGPALVDSVRLRYRDKTTSALEVIEPLAAAYPAFTVVPYRSSSEGSLILPAGEGAVLLQLAFRAKVDDGAKPDLAAVMDDLVLDFTFCDVYGTCWRYNPDGKPHLVPTAR